MARLETVRIEKNTGSGFMYSFRSEGLRAEALFDPLTGEARVKFSEAKNMASALETVVHKIQEEAHVWDTNPILPLRIDIDAGNFVDALTKVAPRFGFDGPQPAGEFGTEKQWVRFRAELSLRETLPVAT